VSPVQLTEEREEEGSSEEPNHMTARKPMLLYSINQLNIK
jgi:hypothetical protein